jgi:hypothetical protein
LAYHTKQIIELQVDEIVSFGFELWDVTFAPVWALDSSQREAKCSELAAGPVKAKLEKLAELLNASTGSFLCGDEPTMAE